MDAVDLIHSCCIVILERTAQAGCTLEHPQQHVTSGMPQQLHRCFSLGPKGVCKTSMFPTSSKLAKRPEPGGNDQIYPPDRPDRPVFEPSKPWSACDCITVQRSASPGWKDHRAGAMMEDHGSVPEIFLPSFNESNETCCFAALPPQELTSTLVSV